MASPVWIDYVVAWINRLENGVAASLVIYGIHFRFEV
jgi:hypothetical protein